MAVALLAPGAFALGAPATTAHPAAAPPDTGGGLTYSAWSANPIAGTGGN